MSTPSSLRGSALALVLLSVLAAPVRARAQDASEAASATPEPPSPAAPAAAPPTEDAQALFRRGLELGTQDRWADALSLFLRSRALVERPSTIFNIGVAFGRLGRFREALATLDEFLALPESATGAARAEAERLRADAGNALAELSLEITPDDASVEVDGVGREGSGSPRLVALDPGRHVVRARREGYDDGVLQLSVIAAEHPSATLTLAQRVVEEPPPIVTPPTTSLTDDPIFWVVLVSSVVAVGVGVGVGVGVATSETPSSNGGSTGVVLVLP